MEKYFPPFYNIGVIKVKKLAYIHDLGGTETMDGHKIRPHLLYRSANLALVDIKDIEILSSKYHIKHVIDLRTDDEIVDKDETHIEAYMDRKHIPLFTNEENPLINKETRLGILDNIVKSEGGVKKYMCDAYRLLISSPKAIEGYKQIFNMLINNVNNEGYLIHCTQGKDRTGIVLYLVLSSLGVSEEKIRKIYMSFNHHDIFKRIAIWMGMNIVVSPRKAVALNKILTARHYYFDAALDEVKKSYGDINSYLNTVVGIKESDIIALREKYLV